MIKRFLSCLLIAAIAFVLSGCWNYRGLDQMGIVVGIAIDFDEQENLFDMNYEIADLTSGDSDGGIAGRIVNGKGKTLFDAARNAKRRKADKLFFGSANVLVIDQQLAEEMSILNIIDWFIRDGECREAMGFAISLEDTAKEILESPDDFQGIMSETLSEIMHEDKDVTGTSLLIHMHELYNALHSKRKAVAVPAFHKVESDIGPIPEINGMAIIKDKLVGFLTAEQSRYVLLVENQLGGVVLTLSTQDTRTDDISLEVLDNHAKKSYTYDEGKITVRIETQTNVAVSENHTDMDIMDSRVVEQIENWAADSIQENIKKVLSTLQHKFNADILGFGEMIYKYDLPLWHELSPHWDEIYPNVEVEVSSKVKIINSAFMK